MSITEKKLEELERLAQEATPGPWVQVTGILVASAAALERLRDDEEAPAVARVELGSPDGHFIAAARDAVPLLVAEVRRLREALGEISTACEARELRWGSEEDLERKLGRVVDYVWSLAREALKGPVSAAGMPPLPVVMAQDSAGAWHIACVTYPSAADTACGRHVQAGVFSTMGHPDFPLMDRDACEACLAATGAALAELERRK